MNRTSIIYKTNNLELTGWILNSIFTLKHQGNLYFTHTDVKRACNLKYGFPNFNEPDDLTLFDDLFLEIIKKFKPFNNSDRRFTFDSKSHIKHKICRLLNFHIY